jgi:hypothetical protein
LPQGAQDGDERRLRQGASAHEGADGEIALEDGSASLSRS